ncbi:MAG: division/cell wall cluster transcriptional repressor MraZ [Anaerolineales bacterium]|nr:division/cell wall cluster transcriptional repressor MraZ [Anaerolineales bacterium]
MFTGEHHHTLDAKGRLTIPARYRELLDEGGFIGLGFDSNVLAVMPRKFYEEMSSQIKRQSITNPNMRQFSRFWHSQTEKIVLDKSGRIMVPQLLRTKRGLDGDVVIVGTGEYFELWPPAEWDAEMNRMLQAAPDAYAELDMSAPDASG